MMFGQSVVDQAQLRMAGAALDRSQLRVGIDRVRAELTQGR